jgi:predicted transcriptional regulator
MLRNALLLSIRPKYAEKIFNGTKTVELRRVPPKLKKGDLVFVYVSSPKKVLAGAFTVKKVISMPPKRLWGSVRDYVGMTQNDFDKYYDGALKGIAIYIDKVWILPTPLGLQKLRKNLSWFNPPQSYHYLSSQQIKDGLRYYIKNKNILEDQLSI